MFLKELFTAYLNDCGKLRQHKLDLDNLQFNSIYELRIKAPKEWNINKQLLESIDANQSVFVFYSDTQSYREFYDLSEPYASKENTTYRSYYELYAAIMNSAHDVRNQQSIMSEVENAAVVVVLNVSSCPDIVLNVIRQATDGRLILVG